MKLDSTKVVFNSHTKHNPDCDILEYNLDKDSYITYGVYVSGPKKGERFCEYYRGFNYVVGSRKASYSRYYPFGSIPQKHIDLWIALEHFYVINYK